MLRRTITWVVVLTLAFPAHILAQVANGITIDTKAMSLGGAVVSDTDPHLAAVYHNPAGLAKLKEMQFEVDQMIIGLDLDATYYADDDYRLFGLEGNGFNTYDPSVPRDPVIGGDGIGQSHTGKASVYIPGFGLQQMPWSGPTPLPFQIGFSVNPPGSKFTFGNKNYMHSAGNFFKNARDDGRFLAKEAALQRYTYFSPAVGYEISDEWSVGMGVQLSHQGFYIAQNNRAPNLLIAVIEILQDAFACEFDKPIGKRRDPLQPFLSMCQGNIGPWDDIGRIDIDMQETLSPTYNFGVLWTPSEWFSWGASYMSGSEMELKGTFLMDYTDEWTAFWQGFNASIIGAITAAILGLPRGVPRESGHITMDFETPQMFKTGMSIGLTPSFTLSMDATWTDWSVWEEFEFNFDRRLEMLSTARLLSTFVTDTSLRLPVGLKDTWHYGFGLTHHINSRLDIRYGLELRKSPADRDVFGPVPIGDMKTWGIGFGYKWDKQTQVSSSIFYMQSTDYIPSNTSCNLNCTNLTNVIYNPYAGLDVKFSTRIFGLGVSFRRQF
ncbi:MAG: aromatic hydrocarbon degradation protein [Oleiphilus sp.]|nr:MAG: aromatic hydrocarbon degradation protein [Oleiphilus sp.]